MMKGQIKWFNHLKGYGFIAPEEGVNDVVLGISLCKSYRYFPVMGDTVEYNSSDNRAVFVRFVCASEKYPLGGSTPAAPTP